ncbi:MAG: MerR family transcriptional regulator [Proteobacteria bacterium]|nr:MerR family transcriptional regulator [Pseudomonadota bacterium]
MTGELVADEKGRRGVKSATAFRTISEVASDLSVPSHVLRFWETKFSQVRPLKRGGGRRYYRPEDVDLLRNIRTLLYDNGYTIKGVQKLLREGRALTPSSGAGSSKKNSTEQADQLMPMAESPANKQAQLSATTRGVLSDLLRELEELRKILRRG